MKTIHFSKLAELDDSKHVAFVGLRIDNRDDASIASLKELVSDTLTDRGVFLNGVRVKEIFAIGGNVLGDEGRSDFVFELTGSVADISPLKRIRVMPDLKWLDDFIVNYEKDYESEEV